MGVNEQIAKLLQGVHAGTATPGIEVAVPVTITTPSSGAYDPDTGEVAGTDTSIIAKAIPGEISAQRAAASGGVHHVGDRVFRFAGADLPAGVPNEAIVTHEAARFRVYRVEKKSLGSTVLAYVAYARKEGELS